MQPSRNLHFAAMLGLSLLLTGCGVAIKDAASDGAGGGAASKRVSGQVFGGQQPVTNSTIQLYTVGTSGIATAATPLIAGTVTTDGLGNFSINGQYSCSGSTQVYITATGGNPGAGTNNNLSMMAALGSCTTLQANAATTYININELTTVAAAYALAPFMSNITHVGATGSNPTGLVNAFTAASALVSTANGQIAATPAGVTLPSVRINTLADIVAACVNTTGSASSACNTLFTATGATNTVDAALFIAKNPAASGVTALYSLPTGSPPFLPALTARPNDFTLAVNYTSASLLSPYGLAVDASGNAWLTNEAGNSVTRLSSPSPSFTAQTFTTGGLLSPRGISIDRAGNVWIANTGANTVVKFSSTGSLLSGAGFTAGGINTPIAVANDSAGNAWVANFSGNSVTELSPSGSSSNLLTTSVSTPTAVALDPSGNIAIANAGNGSVCLFSNAGVFQSCPSDGALFGSTSIAVSAASGLVMTGTTTGATLTGAFTLGTSAGSVNTASPVAGGGLTLPTSVAYDGAGTAWFANSASISAFSGVTALTPSTGYGSLNAPQTIAVDSSGNVWTANSGDNSVTIFIGLAAPTVTPLAASVGP